MKKERIEILLEAMERKHINDPSKMDDLYEISRLLSKSETETLQILKGLDENAISWIAPFFDDISSKLQSQEFILCIQELAKKFPSIHQEDIDKAIHAMD